MTYPNFCYNLKKQVGRQTMETTLERLNHWITEVPSRMYALSETDLSARSQPQKWSRKEILGHLCDSALNNLQRFVRAQYEDQPYTVIKHAQNQWVQLMGYQDLPTEHIVSLWVNLNRHVVEVIGVIPEDRFQNSCDVGEEQMVTLEWIINDYVYHLEHHIKQLRIF
jgi:hypothetical protein